LSASCYVKQLLCQPFLLSTNYFINQLFFSQLFSQLAVLSTSCFVNQLFITQLFYQPTGFTQATVLSTSSLVTSVFHKLFLVNLKINCWNIKIIKWYADPIISSCNRILIRQQVSEMVRNTKRMQQPVGKTVICQNGKLAKWPSTLKIHQTQFVSFTQPSCFLLLTRMKQSLKYKVLLGALSCEPKL
jgi:hypothetical protein